MKQLFRSPVFESIVNAPQQLLANNSALRRQTLRWTVGLILVVLAPCAAAFDGEVALHENYLKPLKTHSTISPLKLDAFGDQLSLRDGSVEFNTVDISIPGNNSLPVELRRQFKIEDRAHNEVYPTNLTTSGWIADVPYLHGIFAHEYGWQVIGASPMNRCSVPGPPPDAILHAADYFDGYHLHLPGVGDTALLSSPDSHIPAVSQGTYPWITQSFWRIGCVSTTQNYPGEGFVLLSPTGLKYTMDYVITKPTSKLYQGYSISGVAPQQSRDEVFFMVSRVDDRFGNWVKYTYANNQLQGIISSDGRSINLTYNGNLTTAESSVGTWTYTTAGNTDTVVQPDGSKWKYVATGALNVRPSGYETPPGYCSGAPGTHCCWPTSLSTGDFTYLVTHPSGLQGSFVFNVRRHYRNNIPEICKTATDPTTLTNYHWLGIPIYSDTLTLLSKQISGPGVTPFTLGYTYDIDMNLVGHFTQSCSEAPPGSPCSRTVATEVAGPDGYFERDTFGAWFNDNAGQLLKKEIGSDADHILKTENYSYIDSTSVQSQPFPENVGTDMTPFPDIVQSTGLRPLQQKQIVQDGAAFTKLVNTYDVFANPTQATRSSSLGSLAFSKTDTITYNHNFDLWVLSQIKSVTDIPSGLKSVENVYNETTKNATLASTSAFGVLQSSYTYNSDGTLATIADGKPNTTTLLNWKLGIPQTIQHPDGTTDSAVVNDAGLVLSVTQPIGDIPSNGATATTVYGYDAMGRINKITPPTPDDVNWKPTYINFEQVTSTSEFGLAPGHWRQTTVVGNDDTGNAAITVSYFDAFLHPVMVSTYERNDQAGTQSMVTHQYDALGRATFSSYPATSIAAYNSAVAGNTTAYDALDRPTSSTQDSELGPLLTKYAYLSGFQTKVTSPRGFNVNVSNPDIFSTITSYQAFDTPDTSHPVMIDSPGPAVTLISRDVFGKPLLITRGDENNIATRSYVYDANQRLCKRVEPETGATLMDYDAAGNIAWIATGSALTTSTCDRGNVALNDKTLRTYDARNRPLTVDVAHSTDDLAYSYYNDGALKTLTNGSSPGNTWRYAYNKKRLPTTETLTLDGRTQTIAHGYDVFGHESTLTYPSGMFIAYTPNPMGQPGGAGNPVTDVSYFPNGAMKSFTYGNGVVHTLTQNARQLPLRSLDKLPGPTALLDDTYTYDENANVTVISDGTPGNYNGRTMAYDHLDRLTGTAAPGQPWVSASTTYDALDNIRTNNLGSSTGGRNYDYSYDANNRLYQLLNHANGAVKQTFGYDANGNITSRTRTDGSGNDSYVFDAANRLQSVTGKESYQYDGYGRRVKITSGTFVDYPVYSMSGQLITEDDQRNNTSTNYINLNGSLVAKRTTNIGHTNWTTFYEHTDALHSPITETDATGTVAHAERYTPFGEPSDGIYTQGPGFTGHVTDAATGLTYAQQRYYDPVLVHFLSADPMLPDDTGGKFNRYSYANNNPFRFTDPDGRDGANFYNYSDHPEYQMPQPDPAGLAIVASLLPGVGAVMAIAEAVQAPTAANIAIAAISVIPEVGGLAKGMETASALDRAAQISGTMSKVTQSKVTIAVAETAEGTRVVGSSEGSLRTAAKAALQPGEVAAKGTKGVHAEVNAVKGAKKLGLTPISVAPSRPACVGCQDAMNEAGVSIQGPLKPR